MGAIFSGSVLVILESFLQVVCANQRPIQPSFKHRSPLHSCSLSHKYPYHQRTPAALGLGNQVPRCGESHSATRVKPIGPRPSRSAAVRTAAVLFPEMFFHTLRSHDPREGGPAIQTGCGSPDRYRSLPWRRRTTSDYPQIFPANYPFGCHSATRSQSRRPSADHPDSELPRVGWFQYRDISSAPNVSAGGYVNGDVPIGNTLAAACHSMDKAYGPWGQNWKYWRSLWQTVGNEMCLKFRSFFHRQDPPLLSQREQFAMNYAKTWRGHVG